jgi:hypothetical protein
VGQKAGFSVILLVRRLEMRRKGRYKHEIICKTVVNGLKCRYYSIQNAELLAEEPATRWLPAKGAIPLI